MLKRIFLNEKIILGIILLNSILILLAAFDNLSHHQKELIRIFDNVITLVFLLELILKMKEYGIIDYFKSNWNKLDFILVVLSIPALISFTFNLEITNLSFVLVFRVLRVFKSFRFLKFIPGISDLIKGIRRAIKTSVIIILGFFIYIFIIGIFSTYLFQNIAPEHFSNPILSFYSIFKIFTVEGWYEIPEIISSRIDSTLAFFSNFYFIFVVVTGGIFGLSLVNSIFVDAMLTDNTDDISKKIDNLEKKIDSLSQNK